MNRVAQEKVYDVVWSGYRKPDANGKLTFVGSKVDVGKATWTNTIGTPDLMTTEMRDDVVMTITEHACLYITNLVHAIDK